MKLFPAIDILEGKAVRLLRGDYAQKTVYSNNPAEIALDFKEKGAKYVHIVDLEGAKSGDTPNFETVVDIKRKSGLFCEIGGGIRSIEVIDKYINAGIDRVILGTAAVSDKALLLSSLEKYGDKIAVGADIKNGRIAVKGWLESSDVTVYQFFEEMSRLGVDTVICTDIRFDGAMKGTNLPLYQELSQKYDINVTASGGVSSTGDVIALKEMGLHGAIIGKAYYEKTIDLKEALEAADDN